ncbi:MAG: NADH-quinone oxidoreductase subunit M [Pseudomonadota bacterium]|nr:NADH-quinone oxidoreductase subunit M [Pseudomonadota bacterium]
MILIGLLVVLLIGAGLAWYGERWGEGWPRRIAYAALGLDLLLAVGLWLMGDAAPWLAQVRRSWIPRFGITFHLAADGLSLLLVLLTLFLGLIAVAASVTEIRSRLGFFHFNLLCSLAGVVGVFLALDLFLFFVFWEAMLVPMYFLIGIWGHENRVYAALKFVIFTQAGGLLMLLAILALAFAHREASGSFTFDYLDLLDAALDPGADVWIMAGFFIAFAVKLPMVPFHTWLPDAHTEAPTAGSVILAGVLLKTGAYGLIRFVVPLFPDAAYAFAPLAMTLGVVGILYGAVLAFAQTDFKRLVAYTSISHLGFVLLGVFAGNAWALQGAVMQMLAHGASTGALFVVAGQLQERLHGRDLERMGGLWAATPRLAALALLFAMASLGLPGLGNFVGEFLVLLGAFQVDAVLTAAAALGLVGAAAYALRLVQCALHGPPSSLHLADLDRRETAVMAALAVVVVWLGLYPRPLLETARPALEAAQILAVADRP